MMVLQNITAGKQTADFGSRDHRGIFKNQGEITTNICRQMSLSVRKQNYLHENVLVLD